jgi:hypothetical protein
MTNLVNDVATTVSESLGKEFCLHLRAESTKTIAGFTQVVLFEKRLISGQWLCLIPMRVGLETGSSWLLHINGVPEVPTNYI